MLAAVGNTARRPAAQPQRKSFADAMIQISLWGFPPEDSIQYPAGWAAPLEADDMNDVVTETIALRRWLFDAALPLWWRWGADRKHGGFHEAIGLDGKVTAQPHRARTIARMVFSYCEAGRLGWNGPWREAAQHALNYLRSHFIAADGAVASMVGVDGRISDATFDLYDQAFALLAYANAHRAFGEAAGWRRQALALRTRLEQRHAHSRGGFREDRNSGGSQRSNPHMHLFESALAWVAVDNDPAWRRMADGI